MIDFIFSIILYGIGIIALLNIGAWMERKRIELEDEGYYDDEDNGPPVSVIATVEQHNGILYAWDVEHSDFLGQGQTLKQLEEHIRERIIHLYTRDVEITLTTVDDNLAKELKV